LLTPTVSPIIPMLDAFVATLRRMPNVAVLEKKGGPFKGTSATLPNAVTETGLLGVYLARNGYTLRWTWKDRKDSYEEGNGGYLRIPSIAEGFKARHLVGLEDSDSFWVIDLAPKGVGSGRILVTSGSDGIYPFDGDYVGQGGLSLENCLRRGVDSLFLSGWIDAMSDEAEREECEAFDARLARAKDQLGISH
jgi:hypothetical protein